MPKAPSRHIAASALLGMVAAASASAQPSAEYLTEREPARHALVIGNSHYLHLSKIGSALADADGIAQTFTSAGFRVHRVEARSLREFEDTVLPSFRKDVNPGDVVVVFFSGHGFAEGAYNYIAPLDLPSELARDDLPNSAISLEALEYYFSAREPGLLLFLVDACRSLSGFKVRPPRDKPWDAAVLKGSMPPAPPPRGINFMVGFAARPGSEAIGWNSDAKISPFTSGLLSHIGNEGLAFKQAFDEASADVQEETREAQHPGLINYSTADLWIKPSPQILRDQTDAWLAVLATGDPSLVRRFVRRHSTSRYAHAARRWLERNPEASARISSPVAPVAVEAAWNTASTSKTVARASGGMAFDWRQSARASTEVSETEQQRILTSSQGGVNASESAKLFQRDIALFKTYGGAVTNLPQEVRGGPWDQATAHRTLPPGTRVNIVGSVDLGKANRWYEARLPGEGNPVFLKATTPQHGSVSLGIPLLEVEALPKETGLRDLVQVSELDRALANLKAAGNNVRWVSLATGQTNDEYESDMRSARLAHAAYLLRVRGIDPGRLTSVTDAQDVKGDGVRIRFFGNL
jgi:hypothetical protein